MSLTPQLTAVFITCVFSRWGNIALDDAIQFNHLEVVKLLQDYQDTYVLGPRQDEEAAEDLSKENLESMV